MPCLYTSAHRQLTTLGIRSGDEKTNYVTTNIFLRLNGVTYIYTHGLLQTAAAPLLLVVVAACLYRITN